MAKVTVEFVLKGGDKLVTSNDKIIKQLVEQNAQYNVLEGNITDVIGAQNNQKNSTDNLTKSYKNILKEYKEAEKELKALAIAGDTTSDRYKELSSTVGAARSALEDANRAGNAQKSVFDTVAGSARGVVGGFTAVKGALGLLGVESENVQKALLGVQSALALSQGLKDVTEAIPTFGKLGKTIKGPLVAAFTSLKGAIIATGIGAAVVAVGLLIANFDEVKKVILNLFPGLATLGKFLGNLIQQVTDFVGITSAATRAAEALGKASQERLAISNQELAILRARGATQEEIAAAERAQANQRIDDLNKLAELNGELTEKELAERTELVNKLQIIDATEAKRREDETKVNEEKLNEVRRTNAQRRVDLLQAGITKELAQLKLGYEEQRKAAIKNGEDLKLVDELYSKQRIEIINNNITTTLKQLSDFNEQTLKLSSFNYIKELNQLNEQFNLLTALTQKQINEISELRDKERKLRQNDLDNLNTQLIIAENNFNIKRLNIQEKYLKQAEVLYETYQRNLVDINFFQFSEEELNLQLNDLRDVIKSNQQQIINDEITYRRRLFAIAFDADDENLKRGIELFKKRKELNDEEFDFINARTRLLLAERKEATDEELDNLLKSVIEKSEIEKKAFDKELILYRDAQFKKAELRSDFEVKTIEVIKKNNQLSLDLEIDRLNALNAITTNDLVQRRREEAEINAKFDRKQIDAKRITLLTQLKLAKDAFGAESEEFKKIQLELAQFAKEQNDNAIKLREQQFAQFTQVFQQFLTTLNEIGAAVDSFYELRLQRSNQFYDNELKRNEELRNAEINNFALSQEEIANINQRYALENTAIEEERARKNKELEKKRADFAFAIQVGQIIGNGALAVVRALAELGPIFGPIAAGLIGATTGAQLVVARNQQQAARQLGDGGLLYGPSHSAGGIPIGNTGVEVEGGESVINKRSTELFLPLLNAINLAGGGVPLAPGLSRMQNGGIMGNNGTPVIKTYLVSSDVASDQAKLARIKRNSIY